MTNPTPATDNPNDPRPILCDDLTVDLWIEATVNRPDAVAVTEDLAWEVHRLAAGHPNRAILDTTECGGVLSTFANPLDGVTYVLISTAEGDSLAWETHPEWRVETPTVETTDETADLDESVSRCPACGDPIDYCPGHGESGDPDGYATLVKHDSGNHLDCHPDGCDLNGTDPRPCQIPEGLRAKVAERICDGLYDSLEFFEDYSDADVDSILWMAARGDAPQVPEVWIVERVTHGDHVLDDSGDSCTDECVGELAVATWYPTQLRACEVADELTHLTFVPHRASLLVLDPDNPTL